MHRFKKTLAVLLLLFLLIGSMVSCRSEEKKEIQSLADLEEATIGIVTGSSWDIVVQTKFPKAERKYFSSPADILLALEQGKVDTFFADETIYVGMRWENSSISHIDEPIQDISNALILAKEGYDENLLRQINEFVAKTKEDGTLTALSDKWFGSSEPEEHPDYTHLTGENGTLKVAVSDSIKATAYQRGTMYTGYEIDFLLLFAEEYGYKLDIEGMTVEALIPAVSSGKFDIGACGLTITPERAESVTFADSHFETHGVAVVRNESGSSKQAKSLEDLKMGSVAIMTGTIWDDTAKQDFPDAERKYFTSMTDMIMSLEQGKVDAIFGDRTFYVSARWENVPVVALEETIGSIQCGFMLNKEDYDRELLGELNEFIAQAKADGTIAALAEKWFADTEPEEHPDYMSLTGEKGTLKIAVDDTAKSMTYRRNESFTGMDVEILTEFARAYGYRLEIDGMAFNALISAVSSGKYDISACGTAITDERMESVTFTDPYLEVDGVAIIQQQKEQEDPAGFLKKISDSFEKTFIREGRWRLILQGIGVTMLISICAVAGGTLVGLGLYMLGRSKSRLIRRVSAGFARVYSRLIAGTPVVVILMILFYVVFGNVRNMSGIVVAIIGFTLTFGAFVHDHMTVSVSSVDQGQTEAAYALGYTKNKTFFRIVFPQAMRIFLPSYCSQAVELVKATAVVGYIAVNDLTKMGDIIRSNTYEAFFPLFATAVIYFFLTWGLSLLLRLVKKRFEPKRRTGEVILKGVRTK